MTQLTLLRHAKSSWDHPDLRDIDRPLNDRGKRDATLMSLVCAERISPPDLVLVSPAQRTRETIELFCDAWVSWEPEIVIDDRLYLAGRGDWRQLISDYHLEADHILACSHQPGVGDFARWLCREFDGNIPTATVISLRLKKGEVAENCGDLDFVGSPKQFRY